MIICPVCKEEIDTDSRYCDQCGHALLYCKECGRVGVGRRCTSCGGMMVSADNRQAAGQYSLSDMSAQVFKSVTSTTNGISKTIQPSNAYPNGYHPIPTLLLINSSLNIRIVGTNGAVIGRRQGPYREFFEQNMYVSGVHAQLSYHQDSGWSVTDKHSSNGTKLNQRPIQPNVAMKLNNDDVLTIANVNLQVKINQ